MRSRSIIQQSHEGSPMPPALQPSSIGAGAEAPDSFLSMVLLVDVVLELGLQACPHLSKSGLGLA